MVMDKIWIVHIKCGSGHTKAAQAVWDVLKEDRDVALLNLTDFGLSSFKYIYETGYGFLIKYFPLVWFLLYKLFSNRFFCNSLLFQHLLIFGKFIRKIKAEKPEVVITTHFFASQLVAYLKRKGFISSKLITIITDFGVHRFWVNRSTDYYITASQEATGQLRKQYAINSEKIHNYGIPLRQQFYEHIDCSLKDKYQKPDNITTVLIFSGGLGIGPFELLIDKLYKKCGILTIYGRNKNIGAYIRNLERPLYLKGFEYKEEVWELMRLSDIVVTKAGGLSVSECIALKKPIIFMSAIPGQESYNINFVLKNKLGFYPGSNRRLLETIEWLVNNPDRLKEIENNFSQFEVQNSPLLIGELIDSIVSNTFRGTRDEGRGMKDEG